MDAIVPGLGVRVMGSGSRTFILAARFPGRRAYTRVKLGTYGAMTLEGARAKARDWILQIEAGVHPKEAERRTATAEGRRRANTFAAVAEDFIARHVSRTRKAAVVERELRREFIERWGSRPITDITQHDVVEVLDAAVDRGAPYQAHNLLCHVRALFNWAIGRGVYGLDRSPCDRLRPVAVIGKKLARDRVLSDGEVKAAWAAGGAIGYPFGPLVQMLLITGQRKSEVSDARWSEFDLDAKLWTIPARRMKGDAVHVVPLSDMAIEVLERLPYFDGGDHLFTTTNGVKPVNGFSRAKLRLDAEMLAAMRTDTIDPFVLHDIRRTVRTGLSALPIPDIVRELVIAHAQKGLHKVYDRHAYLEEKRAALELWATRLQGIVSPIQDNVVRMVARA